ncbi:threonine/homoserine/homoserine lactone efflux protein [Kineococcus xinjiangensis]|uniref:Threonine/homoserine/homoserine lactone efflux protein n=1 Tax=Kineococcus xinjiangensis TaxID=512762 RepID=A0A2S6IT31_9ACTN|nr:LysE family translocator [Kineococcus xinjiangensis]PPK97414.1 threonine/homoserine/homoserine lactone efflux protein [Kineococcus xinjiangensis]
MTADTGLWAFTLGVGLLTITPGMDTALILRTAAVGAPRRAWGVVMGIQSGTLAWGVLASAGLAALLTASAVAYEVLRWAGACYLVWIGVGMVWGTIRRRPGPEPVPGVTPGAGDDVRGGWRRGLLTNLLNPKVGAFYVAVLPHFIPAGANHLAWGVLLTCIHIGLGLAWSSVLILCARRMRGVLQRPATRRFLDRVAGTVIAGFGVRLAVGD